MTIQSPFRLALLGLALAGLACNTLIPAGPTLIPAESPTPGGCSSFGADVAIDGSVDGQTVTLSNGDALAITLASNASTGFEWTVLTIDPNLLHYDGKEYNGSLNPMPGSGGSESLCFTALASGTSRLALIYHRTFEQGVPPIQTFTITLEAD